jgi:hypothetical protein
VTLILFSGYRVSVERRRERAVARKRTALDWAAHTVEENGRELAESCLSAARNGNWRAAEALMNRIYGKPEQALVAHVAPSPVLEIVRSLSLDDKLELLRRLQDGEFVSAATALPVVNRIRRPAESHPRERDRRFGVLGSPLGPLLWTV